MSRPSHRCRPVRDATDDHRVRELSHHFPNPWAWYTHADRVIRSRGHTGSVPNSDVHPDLRRIARFAPRQLITPRSLRLVRALSGLILGDSDTEAEAITLGSGVGVRLFRPAGVTEPTAALLWIHGGGY